MAVGELWYSSVLVCWKLAGPGDTCAPATRPFPLRVKFTLPLMAPAARAGKLMLPGSPVVKECDGDGNGGATELRRSKLSQLDFGGIPALRSGAADVGDQVSDEYSGIGGLMRPDELAPEMVLKLPESWSFLLT